MKYNANPKVLGLIKQVSEGLEDLASLAATKPAPKSINARKAGPRYESTKRQRRSQSKSLMSASEHSSFKKSQILKE